MDVPEQAKEDFTQRLKRLLGDHTPYWLAQQSGLSVTYADRLVKGKAKRPSYETMGRLATALNVSVDVLMGIEVPAPVADLQNEGLPQALVAELLDVWPDLSDEDRQAVLAVSRSVLARYKKRRVAERVNGVAET